MKKLTRILFILIIFLTFFSFFYSVSASSIWDDAKSFLSIGRKNPGMTTGGIIQNLADQNSKNKFEEAIDFIWGLGLLTIFLSTIVLGIRYMFANPNEKSRVKQATTPYVVGVTVIFGALTIWKLMIYILDGSL